MYSVIFCHKITIGAVGKGKKKSSKKAICNSVNCTIHSLSTVPIKLMLNIDEWETVF